MSKRIFVAAALAALATSAGVALLVGLPSAPQQPAMTPNASAVLRPGRVESEGIRLAAWAPRVAPAVLADGEESSVESVTPAPPVRRLAQLATTRAQDELLWTAEQKAVAVCMLARGFTYAPRPFDDTDDVGHEITRIEPDDMDAAQERGYGLIEAIVDSIRPPPEPDPVPPDIQQLDSGRRREFVQALLGPNEARQNMTPENGWDSLITPNGATTYWYRNSCYASARRRVHGEEFAKVNLNTTEIELTSRVEQGLESDPEYQAALSDWRACMAAQGHPYDRPGAAADALSAAYQDGKLSRAELEAQERLVAVADASCYQTTHFAARLETARSRQEQVVLEGAQEKVTHLLASREQAFSRARDILRTN